MTRVCCADCYASRPTVRAIDHRKVADNSDRSAVSEWCCFAQNNMCVEKGLAKLDLCKISGSLEASSNCKADVITNLICEHNFDD